MTVVTQNIDGLHRRAGSKRVVELHGDIRRVRCFEEDVPIDVAEVPGLAAGAADGVGPLPSACPRCPRCGGHLRPDVVWFGEALPVEALIAAVGASQTCDVFLSVGTSGLVEPAASLPYEALRSGAVVVEVNPEATALAAIAPYTIAFPAASALPALVRAAWGRGVAAATSGEGSQAASDGR
jgi:NAD-dependent deacetylase